MKNLFDVYNDIRDKFYTRTKLDIEQGTVIDSYNLSVSDAIGEAYKEIENSKDPHIYTNLKEQRIDSAGLLVNCARLANEEDKSYLHRLMEWNVSNEASNSTAINNALMALEFSSTALYVPLTEGVSTATCYIFPKSYDGDIPEKAKIEAINRIKPVASPSTVISYKIPEIRGVKLAIYLSSESGDIPLIQKNIKDKVKKYINSIAPGDYLEVGAINNIGVTEPNVDYFNIVQLTISDQAIVSIKILQKLDSKFIFDSISWLEVVE